MSLSRRRVLRAGTGLAAVGALPLPAVAQGGAAPPKPDRIVVNASGGSMANLLRRTYFTEFERRHGIRVVDTSPVDFGKLRAMVESGNPEWTVTEMGGQDFVRAKELNLLEPLDLSVDRPVALPGSRCATPSAYPSSVYSTFSPTAPTPSRTAPTRRAGRSSGTSGAFPGPGRLRNHPVDNLEYALLADGVASGKLYPLDMDRAFRKLDEVRQHVTVWWSHGRAARAAPRGPRGGARLGLERPLLRHRAAQGAPVAVEWQGGALKQSTYGIPADPPSAYWGQRLFQVMTEPRLQAIYATELAYPGLHPDTPKFVDDSVKPYLPTTPANLERQFWISVDWWTANGQRAQERWNRWMLRRA